jgi:hypothetical protein
VRVVVASVSEFPPGERRIVQAGSPFLAETCEVHVQDDYVVLEA